MRTDTIYTYNADGELIDQSEYQTKGSEHFSRTPARSKFRDAPEFGLNGGMKAVCSANKGVRTLF
jgi:hypothetical protein